MKRLLVLMTALMIGCVSTPVVQTDVCEQIAKNTKSEITVLHTEKDWEIYFVTVGGKLARNMRIGSEDCVEVNVLHAPTNQELKGYYCMEQRADGWYTIENICEYTQGVVTDRSIGVYKKLTP